MKPTNWPFKTILIKKSSSKTFTSRSKKSHEGSVIRHQSTSHRWPISQDKYPSKQVNLIVWNVNGFRSITQKGQLQKLFKTYCKEVNFVCLNQTKLNWEKYNKEKLGNRLLVEGAEDYEEYWNFCKVSAGYQGVMTFARHKPMRVVEDMPQFKQHNHQGRMLTLEYSAFYIINLYKPNSGDQVIRLPYRLEFESCLLQYIKSLQPHKPVILCGDMNVANEPIDLTNPKPNEGKACYTLEQRQAFKKLLVECDMVDAFRELHPSKVKYSFWSYRRNNRDKNVGWRLDYVLVDKRLQVLQADMLNDVYGSDHCPVKVKIKIKQNQQHSEP